MSQPLKLHLGAGHHRMDGWVNCDRESTPATDLTFDVQQTWPILDASAEVVYASHMLEHLSDPMAFFREAWRVLRPGGRLDLRLPYGGHKSAWWDVTHLRPWFAETFCALQPGYAQAIGNPQHTDWPAPFGIETIQLRVARPWARRLRFKPLRRLVVPHVESIPNAIEEIHAHLYALKRPPDVAAYAMRHHPALVPIEIVAYSHHVRGAPRPDPDEPAFRVLGVGQGMAGHN